MLLTRKDFFGGTAALFAATALGANAKLPRDKYGKIIDGFGDLNPGPLQDKPWEPFSEKKVRMGIAGEGYCNFGSEFGYQSHPNSVVVAVAEINPKKRQQLQECTNAVRAYETCEEMIEKEKEIDALYIATDAPSHMRLAIMALNHGLHVVTAVPAFFGEDQLQLIPDLVEAVKRSGKVYQMNETTAFRAVGYRMRKLFEAGLFGEVTYTEGEYFHPHRPYNDLKAGKPCESSYKGWRDGLPPQYYPTHSNGYYTCITHRRFVDVACSGTPSLREWYKPGKNRYGNPYGSEFAFLHGEEGSAARMLVAWDQPSHGGEIGRMWGQKGCYVREKPRDEYHGWFEKEYKEREQEWRKPKLPPGMPCGQHGGSHGYLTDDFLRGILVPGHKVCVDLKTALDTTIAGVYAHMSAMKGGETLKIPACV